MSDAQFPLGQRIHLPGHFPEPVVLESVRPIGSGYECRVRLSDGTPDEAIISQEEAASLLGHHTAAPTSVAPVDPERFRLLIESARVRLAYAYDKHFAVSLSGIRTLPHQIEAVYLKMLPQPRLRFLLADDPGAGKTIMAGLLIKEMKLREAIERVLILCPSPLTIQWQDELLRWFNEPFDIIFSAVDQQQLVNPWRRSNQVIASLDYAKQEGVRERVWNERWDMVIIDEAHKCSAYTKSATGRSDEVEKTKRYQLAERIAGSTDNFLLLTALTLKLGEVSVFGDQSYPLFAKFTSVTGLKVGSPVQMLGMQIGRVAGFKMDQNDQVAVVEFNIGKDVKIYEDAIASIKTDGLLGDKYVKIDAGGGADMLKPGGTIRDTEAPVDLMELISKYAFGDVEKKQSKENK